MRKIIIDTDTGSDDAAAIIMAAYSRDIQILGVTTVAGNVPLEQAAQNAMATLEVCGRSDVPVYLGASRPLFRERPFTVSVHGADGMGDCGLIHPKMSVQSQRAVDYILETVNKYPGEVEIIALGPATNIALAVLTDREIMRKVKHIWSMGTTGFGIGNTTPVSEFNVFIDAEAYALMLEAGIPITIVGFDMCGGSIGLDKSKLETIAAGNEAGRFLEKATREILQFYLRTRGQHVVELADSVAMAVALWPEFTQKKVRCYCHCCTEQGPTYGQVIFYQEGRTYEAVTNIGEALTEVVTQVDEKLFTERFLTMLTRDQRLQ